MSTPALRLPLEKVAMVKKSTCVLRVASFNPKLHLFEKMGAVGGRRRCPLPVGAGVK